MGYNPLKLPLILFEVSLKQASNVINMTWDPHSVEIN